MLLFGGFTRTGSRLRFLYKCVRVTEKGYPPSFHGSGVIRSGCSVVSALGIFIFLIDGFFLLFLVFCFVFLGFLCVFFPCFSVLGCFDCFPVFWFS